eukprot:TRINITY_DN31586_c0_g1_i1.p1 TRINITY_DN31586_c0_g1~~TRINITY_DN31586_c0_g1_i1.p1  ORF type:complete len:215 (+),score=12.72 TRINITY_DN31586_c0_g1_i1:37-645(+)
MKNNAEVHRHDWLTALVLSFKPEPREKLESRWMRAAPAFASILHGSCLNYKVVSNTVLFCSWMFVWPFIAVLCCFCWIRPCPCKAQFVGLPILLLATVFQCIEVATGTITRRSLLALALFVTNVANVTTRSFGRTRFSFVYVSIIAGSLCLATSIGKSNPGASPTIIDASYAFGVLIVGSFCWLNVDRPAAPPDMLYCGEMA